MLATITPVILFIAWLLLLLVSVSVPITKTIYLYKVVVNVGSSLLGANGSVTFGLWGYCVSNIDVTVLGSAHDNAASCSKVKLGYTVDSNTANALHQQQFANSVSKGLTAALVLHPIACGLTFLAFVISLSMHVRRGSTGATRIGSLATLSVGILAALLTTIVFFIDVGLIASVMHKLKNETHGDLQLKWGNAVWMVLGAAIGIWASLVGACVGVCCGRRNKY